jgi:hypothetical protein
MVWAAELTRRGPASNHALDERRAVRGGPRHSSTRSRQPRFQNRRHRTRWLPPSGTSRVASALTWARRLARLCPLGAISLELVTFDLQRLGQPELSSRAYQQETLAGSEVREDPPEKWERACSSCGFPGVPLQVERNQARATGETERLNPPCLACAPCSRARGAQDLRVVQPGKPIRLARLLTQAQTPRQRCRGDQEHRSGGLRPAQARGLSAGMRLGGLDEVPSHADELAPGAPDGRGLWWQQDGGTAPSGWPCSPAAQRDRTWEQAGMQLGCARPSVLPARGSEAGRGLQTGDSARATVTTGTTAAATWAGCWCAPADRLTSARTGAGCRAGAIVARTPVHRSDGCCYQIEVWYGQELPSQAASAGTRQYAPYVFTGAYWRGFGE